MKKYISVILAGLLLATVAVTWASTLWVGSYVSVNNTTYDSPTNSIATLNLTLPSFAVVLSNNLARTTDCIVYHDVSLDGVNWTNDSTFTFPATNAGSYNWQPGVVPMTVFGRLRIVDTNQNYLGIISTP